MAKSRRKTMFLNRNRYDCICCGPQVRVDEDACCAACGRQTVIVERGVPDYSLVYAGMEAEDDLMSRLLQEARSPPAPEEPRLRDHPFQPLYGTTGGLCVECGLPHNTPPDPEEDKP